MSEWRPEGWENPYLAVSYDINNEDKAGGHPEAMHILFENSKVYEAGADAIVAALKEDSSSERREPEPWFEPPIFGTWVFFPDEE